MGQSGLAPWEVIAVTVTREALSISEAVPAINLAGADAVFGRQS